MITRRTIIVFLVAVSFGSGAFAEEKPLGIKEYTSVDGLAASILSYFPRVQGEVKAVQGDQLTVALGTRDGLHQGIILTVWRDGKDILHPVTNAVIGRAEEEVGALEVTEVGEATSTGVMKKKLKEPKQGDKARITPKKISLAIIPLRADGPEIIRGLAEQLGETGRFSVLDKEQETAFLNEKKQRDSSLIKEMGRAFKLDVVLTVEVIPSGDKHLVTTRLFYADDARPIDTIVAMLDLRTKRDALGEIKPFFAPVKEQKTDIAELPFDARLFAAADFEGSGALQYVISDNVKLHVFKQGTSGWREEWVEKAAFGAGEMQHINLDAADINGDGRPELFVTAMLKGTVISYVLECRDGVYKRIADVPGFLRVVSIPGKGGILVGQAYHPVSFFAGQPKQYVWSEGNYVSGAEFPLPEGVGLYGFVYADFGEAALFLVALDAKEQLRVYSSGVPVWKSEETYPAVRVTVTKPVTGIDAMLSPASAESDKTLKVKLPGRVLTLDLNGDGRDEILLPKNSGGTFFSGHTKAEFVGLGWTGARLEQRWNIKDIPASVLDYQVIRRQGADAQVLALVMTSGGLFSRDTYQVMNYPVK